MVDNRTVVDGSNLHQSLTDMLVNAINVARHYEPAIQPIGNFETGISEVWKSFEGMKIADALEMALLGHDTAPHIVANGLAKVNSFLVHTPLKTGFTGAGDDDQKSRPETPADPAAHGGEEKKYEDQQKYDSDENKQGGKMD